MMLIVVAADEHPQEDAWVIERASDEAAKTGMVLPPYQGLGMTPAGKYFHLYGSAEDADGARRHWSDQAAWENTLKADSAGGGPDA